jgi:hypothetical protein
VKWAIALVSIMTLVVLGGGVVLVVFLVTTPAVGDLIFLVFLPAIFGPLLATPAGILAEIDAIRKKRWVWCAWLLLAVLVGLIVPYSFGSTVAQQLGSGTAPQVSQGELSGALLVLAPPFLPPLEGLLYLLLTRSAKPTPA